MTAKSTFPDQLEVSFTHDDPQLSPRLVQRIFDERRVMIGTANLGPDPERYESKRVGDIRLMYALKSRGGAVIASYPGVLKPNERLIGWAQPIPDEYDFERMGWLAGNSPLFGLRLAPSEVRVIDANSGLSGLDPVQRAVQTCHNRATGALWDAVRQLLGR